MSSVVPSVRVIEGAEGITKTPPGCAGRALGSSVFAFDSGISTADIPAATSAVQTSFIVARLICSTGPLWLIVFLTLGKRIAPSPNSSLD
jgi:hypothetical protein